jgi:hypothetical protein
MPPHPRVVNVRAAGGVPVGAVYVGRANPSFGLARSRFANPYRVGPDGDVRAVVESFAERLAGRPALLDAARHELADRVLACWCVPDPCHASVLAWVADGLDPVAAAACTLEGHAEQASLL